LRRTMGLSRKLTFSKRFNTELAELAKLPRLREALAGVYHCLRNDADSHVTHITPVKVGIIKTIAVGELPVLRFAFWILDAKTVRLYSVAVVPDENSA